MFLDRKRLGEIPLLDQKEGVVSHLYLQNVSQQRQRLSGRVADAERGVGEVE